MSNRSMHLYSFLYPNITECVNFSISDSETINITSVFGYYVIPSLSVFGTLVNFLVVLSTGRLNLENKVYKYIQIRSFNDMLICILSIGFQDAACNNWIYVTSESHITVTASLMTFRIFFLESIYIFFTHSRSPPQCYWISLTILHTK